ncbi:zinc-ribbon domain-containing protein [Lachnospiraceae bacterium XBB2008]|nr:zinc-ribbon domain-containing protein [Lachnospiraceae bacterium XBB2008]
MICPVCGKELIEGSRFCTQCGTKLEVAPKQPDVNVENIPISVDAGKQKTPFVWKKLYTYTSIGVAILIVAIIALVVILNKRSPLAAGSVVDSTANQAAQTVDNSADTADVDPEDIQYDQTSGSVEEDIEETKSDNDSYEDDADEEADKDLFNDDGIHSYELVVSDVSWTEAYEQCLRRGGHLVRITSDDECYAVLNQIYSEGKENIKFWIGGYRDDNDDYRWVYNDSYEDRYPLVFSEVRINTDPMYKNYWLDGEPSLYDDATKSVEDRMNMFYVKRLDGWVWNDVPDDVLAVAEFYSGNMGYICEYE